MNKPHVFMLHILHMLFYDKKDCTRLRPSGEFSKAIGRYGAWWLVEMPGGHLYQDGG